MNSLFLLPIFLLTSCSFFKEDPIYYVHVRPPFSYSGTIGPNGFFHYFTNSAVSASADGCDMRIDGACFIKTDIPAEIIKKGIIKAGSKYWCSEDHIQARTKADPKPVPTRGGGYMDYGYGICTENGWITKSLNDL